MTYKLLHIHTDTKFIWDSNKFIGENFTNEVLCIGEATDGNVSRFNQLKIPYRIIGNSRANVNAMIDYANQFDGVVFYALCETRVQILLHLKSEIKTFLRFFGHELYSFYPKKYFSERALNLLWADKTKESVNEKINGLSSFIKRKTKILLGKEYAIKLDNQKDVYKKFDAVLMINKFEHIELSKMFYLPKLIELQFTNHEKEEHQLKVAEKANKIIVGNSRSIANNHIDILDIINEANLPSDIEFGLFFSYGNDGTYTKKVEEVARKMRNVILIENFLSKEEFESIYASSAALVLNSYRQHAVGNIITAIKYGCKIYLNKKHSTYHWLISKGFLISEVDELKRDLETNNFKLTNKEQRSNFDAFVKTIKDYSINQFQNNVLSVLNGK